MWFSFIQDDVDAVSCSDGQARFKQGKLGKSDQYSMVLWVCDKGMMTDTECNLQPNVFVTCLKWHYQFSYTLIIFILTGALFIVVPTLLCKK
jgi:hypothetical protein